MYTASAQNTFVLSISSSSSSSSLCFFLFFYMKMCVRTLEQINVLASLLFAWLLQSLLSLHLYNSSDCCTLVATVLLLLLLFLLHREIILFLLFRNYVRKTLRLMIAVEVFAQFYRKYTTNKQQQKKNQVCDQRHIE